MRKWFCNSLIVVIVTAAVLVGCESMYLQPGTDDDAASTDFLTTGKTESGFFSAVQIDPPSEDSAGPQFVEAADLDGDGLLDLVSGWNESQPVQIHMQRLDAEGEVMFVTLPLGGTTPIARIAGLKIADMDLDGNPDVVVLVKDTGTVATCDQKRPDCDVTDNNGFIEDAIMGVIVIFFAPADPTGGPWQPAVLASSHLAGQADEASKDRPEEGGYTGLDVGDVDGDNLPDIVIAFNSAEGDPKLNSIDLYANPGMAFARDDGAWLRTMINADLPSVRDCKLLDVERDGDLDVVCTYPESKKVNTRWLVNPLDGGVPPDVLRDWGEPAPVGQVHTYADTLALGDIDGDGITDVLVRSTQGKIVQWFKGPEFPSFNFIRNPWKVYALAEFLDREPGAIAVGDLTGDGRVEAVIGAQGALAWFDSNDAPSVFDQWGEHIIIDDSPPEEDPLDPDAALIDMLTQLADPGAQEEAVTETFINGAIIVDLDGDGDNDVVATLDRGGLSGLTADALVWFRNDRVGP